jgi:hypothetical protein
VRGNGWHDELRTTPKERVTVPAGARRRALEVERPTRALCGFPRSGILCRASDNVEIVLGHCSGHATAGLFRSGRRGCGVAIRVHALVPRKVWERRYDLINDWERLLAVENGTTILKFCLVISKEEQLKRFAGRLNDPHRQWKISDSDYKERACFDAYLDAFDAALERTSTAPAPWFTIPCDHKWFRNLAVAHIVLDAMEALDLHYPEPTVDLEQIRRAYHAAAGDAPAGGKGKQR